MNINEKTIDLFYVSQQQQKEGILIVKLDN